MKKIIILIPLVLLAAVATASILLFRGSTGKEISSAEAAQAPTTISPKSAESLQAKVDAVKDAEDNPNRRDGSSHVEVFEAELESYVLFSLKEHIPAKIDSIDVQLTPGAVAADTQITFTSNATGNPMVDALVGGTHNLFIKGKLMGEMGRGKFDLDEIRVDGIPVPKVLIQTLFKKYVKPKYPDADLNSPFDLPWDIEELKLEPGKATVVY
jgi:hypothetical protein